MASRLRSSLAPKISFFAFQDIITCTSGILIIVVLLLGTFLGSVPATSAITIREVLKELGQQRDRLTREIADLKQQQDILAAGSHGPVLDSSDLVLRTKLLEEEKTSLEKALEERGIRAKVKKKELAASIETAGLAPLASEVEDLEKKNKTKEEQVIRSQQEYAKILDKVAHAEAKVAAFQAEKGKIWLQPVAPDTSKAALILMLDETQAKLYEFDRPEKSQTWSLTEGDLLPSLEKELGKYSRLSHYLVIYLKPEAVDVFQKVKVLAQEKMKLEVGWDALESGVVLQSGSAPQFQLEEPEPLPSLPPGGT